MKARSLPSRQAAWRKCWYNFGKSPDGNVPQAGLLDVSGTLYGTTIEGGSYDDCGYSSYRLTCGTVFGITTSGKEKVLHGFRDSLNDGMYPSASLVELNGTLYGTTSQGGSDFSCGYSSGYVSCGTVFSITTSEAEKVVHSFGNGTDGASPEASLIEVKGTLYGTTLVGGSRNCNGPSSCGTVFSVTPSGTEKVLHAFRGGIDGAGPYAPLINVKGRLYRTTGYGGPYSCESGGCGTIFSITPSGTEKVLYSFGKTPDGNSPTAGLIDVGGTLYGTTSQGGTYGRGTVFSLKP